MTYLKPPWFTRRIFNPLAMKLGPMQTLSVTGRHSGRPQQIPVVVPDVDGVRYLVSTRGESTEVPVDQRAPVIAAYRLLAGKVVEGNWRQLADDADHPGLSLDAALTTTPCS